MLKRICRVGARKNYLSLFIHYGHVAADWLIVRNKSTEALLREYHEVSDCMSVKKYKSIFGLYGAGGFAREVMPVFSSVISDMLGSRNDDEHGIFFIETSPSNKNINGYDVISEDEFFSINCDEKFFNIAIADSKSRESIANRCVSKGAKPILVKSPHAVIYDCNEIGEGAIICANSIVTSNAQIGKFFQNPL